MLNFETYPPYVRPIMASPWRYWTTIYIYLEGGGADSPEEFVTPKERLPGLRPGHGLSAVEWPQGVSEFLCVRHGQSHRPLGDHPPKAPTPNFCTADMTLSRYSFGL